MSTSYQIPLAGVPETFTITLAGRELRLRLTAAVTPGDGATVWLLDIADVADDAALVAAVPLVEGCDLLDPYPHLDLGGQLWWRDATLVFVAS